MRDIYANPQLYWEKRLSEKFDLTGVGYSLLGPEFNKSLYTARIIALERGMARCGMTLKDKDVLEVGCGIGFYTEYLKNKEIKSYTGIDITEVSVTNLSEKYPEYQFFQQDISEANLIPDKKFEIILVADVIFHIVDTGRYISAIRNIANYLSETGTLILSDNVTNHTYAENQHVTWHSIHEYRTRLQENSLNIIHLEPIFSMLQPPPYFPESSISWKAYSLLWRYGLLRIAKQRWFDKTIPQLLSKMDQKFFLPKANINTPNSKWLFATKIHAN